MKKMSYKEANDLMRKLIPWLLKHYTVKNSQCETEEFRSYGCIECSAFRTIDFLKEAMVLNKEMEKEDKLFSSRKKR